MSQVSRPMQIVLLVTVLFAALWFVALRPQPSNGTAPVPSAHHGASAPGAKGLGNAIAKAHGAVNTANGGATTTPAATTPAVRPAASTPARSHAATPAHRSHRAVAVHRRGHATDLLPGVRAVRSALRHHKAIAIAFVSASVADARAVAVEMRHVGRFGGRALTLSAPISQLSRYDAITRNVQITVTPTTVIVAPNGDATTIEGFADRGEIEQRLADVLHHRS